MVARVRTGIARGSVTVLDEFNDDSAYAERHILDLTMTDGSTDRREIYLFGSFAEDGRFRSLSEVGFSLVTGEAQ